jgi:hypothetical protein
MRKIAVIVGLALGALAMHAQNSVHATVISSHSDNEWIIAGSQPAHVMAALPIAGMGAASNPYTVTLSWTNGASCGVTVNGSTAICASNVYECQGTCASPATGTWALIGSTAAGATTYSDSAPDAGGSDSYYVTNVVTGAGWNGLESGASNVSTVIFPVQAPQTLKATHN